MNGWRELQHGLGKVANELTCIAYNGPNCVASTYPSVAGTEFNPAILPSPQPAGVYAAIPSMSGGGGANPADPTLPEFLWAATGEPYVPGQTVSPAPAALTPAATPATVTPAASPAPVYPTWFQPAQSAAASSSSAVASSSGVSTTTLLILAALGIGAVLLLGGGR